MVAVPPQVTEGDGTLTNAGRIAISGVLSNDLEVALASGDTTELSVPASVTILAGQSNALFSLTVADDAQPDGAQTVDVTAEAPGFAGGTGTVQVLDNEPPVPFNPSPTNGAMGVPIDATLLWNNSGAASQAEPGVPSRVAASVLSIIERSGIRSGPITVASGTTATGDGRDATSVNVTEPDAIANVRSASDAGIMALGGMNVVVCGAADASRLTDIQAKLIGTGKFNTVTVIDVSLVTPTLAELQAFDAVVVFSNAGYANATALGDVMADYVDWGGGVVCMMFESAGSSWMQGRWNSQGYYAIPRGSSTSGSSATLGTVYDPSHPILQGVTNFNGGSSSYRTVTFDISAGSTRVADWSDGRPLVVTKVIGNTPRADLAFYPPSSDVRSDFWQAATDGARLMANALTWVGGGGADSANYFVYLGTNAADLSLVASNLTQTTWDPSLLDFGTTYYWQVLASNAWGVTTGAVWSFTTADDMIRFASATNFVTEANMLHSIEVVRANGAIGGVTVDYATSNGTAAAGEDYLMVTGTLTFAAGQLTNTFEVPILGDDIWEGNETVLLSLGNPSGGAVLVSPSTASLTIVDDDNVARMPFYEDFESGGVRPYWQVSGTGEYRTQLTGANGPHGGGYHLTMDDSVDGSLYSRNEFTLTINLEGYTNVVLAFWALGYSDESHGPPSMPFIGGADFDGVAISEDGVTWYEVQGLRSLTTTYQQFTVDLDAAIAAHGLSYNGRFMIRFNQYDNYAIATDGIGIDDIAVTGIRQDDLLVSPGTGLSASGYIGGPFEPSNVVYTLVNLGPSNVSWAAACTESWISLEPGSGNLAAGETNSVTLSLTADANGLVVSNYSAVAIISNLTSGVAQTRQAQLNVVELPPPPPEPFNPSPTNGAVGVPTDFDLSWNNPGGGAAVGQLMTEAATDASAIEMLVFNGHSDNSAGGEYENTVAAITGSLSNVNVTATAAEDPATLAFELVGKDVFLMPEQESWDVTSMGAFGANLAGTLSNFVAAGGTVIVCDYSPTGGSAAFLANAGLMTVVYGDSTGDRSATVAAAHPITEGVAATFTAMDGSVAYTSVTNAEVLVTVTADGRPMVAARSFGAGGVVLVGWDCYSYNADMARLLANAAQWPCRTDLNQYFVYFGTNAAALDLVASNLTQTTWDPDLLDFGTTYYWQVLASNVVGVTTGAVWSFTTADDMIRFASATSFVTESNMLHSIEVVRANGALGGVTVDYATSNGTATAGADYLMATGTLTFAVGQLTNTFYVPILDDEIREGDETVLLSLLNPSGGGILVSPSSATLAVIDTDLPQAAYLRSTVGSPWGSTANETAMNKVFGTNGWYDLRFETADVVSLFAPHMRFIFMDGSDDGADELESFLTANTATIQNWVNAGGSLFVNAAPNEGDGMSFGFGVTLTYSDTTATGGLVSTDHPIGQGPFTPVGASWTGTDFGHATVSGTGLSAVITNTATGRIVLGEMDYGSGHALFGGMTTDNYHNPQPEAANLRANILAYGSAVTAPADLAVTASDSPDPVWFGSNLLYVVVVTNIGPNAAYGVVVTNSLPADVAFGSASASQGTWANIAGTVVWSIGTLSIDQFATLSMNVTPVAAGLVTNSATIDALQPDPVPANNVALTLTLVLRDTDGDGMDDAYEDDNGLDPNDPSDAPLDPDGDGLSNLEEYLAGTDPHDRASCFTIASFRLVNGQAIIGFHAYSNRTYQVDFSADLVRWNPLPGGLVSGFEGFAEVIDPEAGQHPARFYRACVRW